MHTLKLLRICGSRLARFEFYLTAAIGKMTKGVVDPAKNIGIARSYSLEVNPEECRNWNNYCMSRHF